MAKAASEIPQVSALETILFVIKVNDLNNNLTIDHLLYADDVKLIAHRKQMAALKSSLVASYKWSEDWKTLPEEIVNVSAVETFKLRLNARWQSLFPKVPI